MKKTISHTEMLEAIEKSKKVIADTVASILSGANSEVTEHLLSYLKLSGESGDSGSILNTSR